MQDPFAIFPDDLEEDNLSAAAAAMQALSQRASFVRKSQRDYRVALSMVGRHAPPEQAPAAGPLPLSAQLSPIPSDNGESAVSATSTTAVIPGQPGFVPRGVTARAAAALDTSGVSSFLSGEAPDGAHVFELTFDQGLLGGLRCSLSAKEGVVTATFHVNNYEAAKKLQSRLPQLGQMLAGRGLRVDRLNVEVT